MTDEKNDKTEDRQERAPHVDVSRDDVDDRVLRVSLVLTLPRFETVLCDVQESKKIGASQEVKENGARN